MTDGGTIGTDDEPADLFVTADPFYQIVPTGGSAYVGTVQLKAANGIYDIRAEDDTVVIEHTEDGDD